MDSTFQLHKEPAIYLAGPMTGRKGQNHKAFHAVAAWARALGNTVVSPAEFGIPDDTPWGDCMRVAARALSYWISPLKHRTQSPT